MIRTRLLASSLLLTSLLGAGCGSDVLLVEVTASPPLPGVTGMGVTVTIGTSQGSGQTPVHDPITLDSSPRTFGVAIPSTRRAGVANLHVCALAGSPLRCADVTVADIGAAIDSGEHVAVHLGEGIAPGPDMAGIADLSGHPDGPDGGAGGHRDGWTAECTSALYCLDFEDQSLHGFNAPNPLNATLGIIGGAGSNYVLRASRQSPGMIRAYIANQLETSTATNGLWLKLRLRVNNLPAMPNFDVIELYSQPTGTSVFLGVYDQTLSLAARRTGTMVSFWSSMRALDGNWHCLTWQVLGGMGTTSDLWFDGVLVNGFHFTGLPPLDFNRVQLGLVSPSFTESADNVLFDDVVITTSRPSTDCY